MNWCYCGKGSKGDLVTRLQQALSIDADGKFGSGTETAVKAFQEENGLTSDGLAGPATLAKLDIFEEFTEETAQNSYMPSDPDKWDKKH